MRSYKNKNKILLRCKSLKAEDICGAISEEFFLSWYRHRFRGYKLKYLSIWHLDIWGFKDEDLGIYPTWKKIFVLFSHLGWSGINT